MLSWLRICAPPHTSDGFSDINDPPPPPTLFCCNDLSSCKHWRSWSCWMFSFHQQMNVFSVSELGGGYGGVQDLNWTLFHSSDLHHWRLKWPVIMSDWAVLQSKPRQFQTRPQTTCCYLIGQFLDALQQLPVNSFSSSKFPHRSCWNHSSVLPPFYVI